MTNREAILFHM